MPASDAAGKPQCPCCAHGHPSNDIGECLLAQGTVDEPAIEAVGLNYAYRNPPSPALEDINFAVPRGSFCAVIGPNGSGKSTLIRLVMGLLEPCSGCVRVLGHDPSVCPAHVQRVIGYVPQHNSINLAPPISVRDVISLAAHTRPLGGNGAALRERVQRALEMVDMADMATRPFKALSGGQKQRTLIARALAVDPHVLVLDEPFGQVDAASQGVISELLHRLAQSNRVTVLVVVHDVNPICHFISHTLLLHTRQVAFGSPPDVLTPDNLREAYGIVVPVLVCEAGYRHPVIQASHD